MKRDEIGNLDPSLIDFVENYHNAKYIPFFDIINNFGEKENRYFDFLIPKLKLPIGFFLKTDLSASMRNGYVQDECNVVLMRKMPEDAISLIEICHELGHIYLASNGYPYVIGSREIADSYKTITSNVIHDPIINKMLFDFKMDVVGYMRKGIQEQLVQFLQCTSENSLNLLDRHYYKCLLIEKIQEWKIIKNAIPNSFEMVAKERMPDILSESKAFVKRIDIVGTRKPQKCKLLLEEVISQNNVSNLLKVTDIYETENA